VVTVAAWSREQTLNCFKLGKTAARAVELMREVYGNNCLSRADIQVVYMIQKWYGND